MHPALFFCLFVCFLSVCVRAVVCGGCRQASVGTVQLWVSGILAVLRVLISQSTEDIVLSRVQELSLSPYLLSCPTIRRLRSEVAALAPPPPQPALTQETNGEPQRFPPEETFAR